MLYSSIRLLSVTAYYKYSVLLEHLGRQRPSGVSDPFMSGIGLGADGQECSYFFACAVSGMSQLGAALELFSQEPAFFCE